MHWLEGILLIPHELLHVLAYRLLRKPVRYVWGERFVTPLAPLTRGERLFGLLFPFGVTFGLALLALAPFVAAAVMMRIVPMPAIPFDTIRRPFAVASLISLALAGYAGVSIRDLLVAWRLLARPERVDDPDRQANQRA